MAGANLPAKKYQHSSPTITRLSFECNGTQTRFISIAKALSIVNRKFYRAGVYYYVNSVEVYNNSVGLLDIHTLPDNWITKNAHARAFKLYQKMNALPQEAGASGYRGKYHDFKVYMSDQHRQRGDVNPSLYDINAQNQVFQADNWDYSQFVSADDNQDGSGDADEFVVHMLGDHVNAQGNSGAIPSGWASIGLIKSYMESRATVQAGPLLDSDLPEDPLINVFDFSSEEQMNDILENLDQHNDAPPYDQDNMIGQSQSSMQHVARLGLEAGAGRVARAAGFCAPLGLICIDPSANAQDMGDYRVVLNIAAGTYHGVYGERAF
jgi:hypothetical protein